MLYLTILVTGASGFLGSYLYSTLIAENYDVLGTSYSGNLQKLNMIDPQNSYDIKILDLRNYEEILKVLRCNEIQTIFHIAAIHPRVPVNDPQPLFETNVLGTLNLLHAAIKCDVDRIIYSSSMSVYGNPEYLPVDEEHPKNPTSFYGLSKYYGENLLKYYSNQHKINSIVLRFSGIHGYGRGWGAVDSFIKKGISNEPPIIMSDIQWDLISVYDAVNALIKTLELLSDSKFEIINIGRGVKIHINELVSIILELCKSDVLPIYEIQTKGLKFEMNIEKAKNLLSYNPEPIQISLMKIIQKYRAHSQG